MFNNENINNKSCERDFLNRSLIDNSKSRICYVDLREKYFGNEISAYKAAKLEQERLEAERLQKLNSVEEGDMMTSKDLEKVVVNAPSSEPVVKLTKEEREKEKARLAKEKEKEKARLAREKEKQKEKERLAREKEKQKEKERLAREKEKQKEKERLAREKEKQKEKERLAKEKEKQKEKERLLKQKEKERLAKEKEKQRELEKKQAKEAAANVNVSGITFETEEKPVIIENIEETTQVEVEVQSQESEEYIASDNVVEEIYESEQESEIEVQAKESEQESEIEVQAKESELEAQPQKSEVVTEKPKMTFEEMLAKKKNDGKQTDIPMDNISKLRQRMEANRKLEQGIVEQDSKKAQALEESKNRLKAMNMSYDEETPDDLYQQIEELEAKIEALQEENDSLTDQLNDSENEKEKILKEQEQKIEQIHLGYVQEISDLKDEISDLQRDLDKQEDESLQATIDKLDQQLDDKNEELERKERIIEDFKLSINESEDEIAELEARIEELESTIHDYQENEKVYEEDLTECEKENHKLFEENEKLQSELNRLASRLQESEEVKKLEELENSNKELEEEVEALSNRISELEEEVNVCKEKINGLEEDSKAKDDELVAKEEEITQLNKVIEKLEKEAKAKADLEKRIKKLEADKKAKKAEIVAYGKTTNELKQKLEELEGQPKTSSEITDEYLFAKIDEINKMIDEKNNQLEQVSSKLTSSDRAIEDSEFVNSVLELRQRKQEVIEKVRENKDSYEASIAKNRQSMGEAYTEYSEVKAKKEEIEAEYQGVEAESLFGEEYRVKSQEIDELELTAQGKIDEKTKESKDINDKFNSVINECDLQFSEISKQENEIIKDYLEKLKAKSSESEEAYQRYVLEKYELLKQLDELSTAQLQLQSLLEHYRNLVKQSQLDTDDEIDRIADEELIKSRSEALVKMIDEKTNEYNRLLHKIELIKEHQEKRVKSEKVLRITDETIVKYNDVITDYETLTIRHQTNDEVLGILKQDLEGLDPENNVEEINSLNVKIANVETLQNDLSSKIDYCVESKDTLEQDDKVNYYIRLLRSMEQLKVKNIEFRVLANNIKTRIDELTAELESLK